ncbi:response regulator transcription factor [Paenibacillus daejeonensis]|uniref:response regulator transcription factor n=1 Tax=Paenibacillus daejeonensis TaxID=135193 RepID=UPI0003777A3A|nr:response regulator transcription factor [Paenibacillus daejeonensis]
MKRILIVEDDPSIANLLKDYLELSGYAVTIAESGPEGLTALEESDAHDLVLLDIMLPGMGGFDVLKTIREKSDMPVLLVSARAEEIYKVNGFGLGADDYITKPFSSGELVARVNAHLNKYERMKERFGKEWESSKLVVRGLEVHKDSRRVIVSGKEVALAQKEFDLLTFLLQHANRVFDKETLFERVWGMDALGDASTVTVHIAKIREKIEDNPSKPQYIGTVWGSGYRFIV